MMMNKPVQHAMLLALGLIWLAQLAFTPLLVSVLFAGVLLTLGWRTYRHTEQRLPKSIQVGFVLLSLGAVYWQYHSFIGVEAGVTLLAVGLFGKALETRTRRDYLIVFNFALFVSASLFLYSQNMAMTLLILLCLISCLIGLYRIQTSMFEQEQVSSRLRKDFVHVSRLIIYAVPFFIVLFIFFPRLPPLWSMPIQANKGVTGISDRMSPGDIAELSQSSALAFRILGDLHKLPEREQLYWRAMVLDQYDGATWTSSFINQQLKDPGSLTPTAPRLSYRYLAADPQQQWIVALEKSVPLESQLQLHQDWSITPTRPQKNSQPHRLQWLGSQFSEQLSSAQQARLVQQLNLKTPQNHDEQTRQLARTLFEQSRQQPELYVQRVLQWYRQNGFSYTLSPGRLGRDKVDEFLFQSRQGFCEHYAGSFTLLMRYAGIPARVVVGYQGGQPAPDGQSWEVRQLDAHAWTEVYLNGQWQRIDPTAAVAPQRIDEGMQNYLEQQPATLGGGRGGALQYRQFALLKNIRIWSDYASYQWQSKVVGYDADTQKNWLARLGLKSVYSYVLILFLSIAGLIVLYVGIQYQRSRQQGSPYERAMQRFSAQLPVELKKQPSETFQQWMARLGELTTEPALFQQLVVIDQKRRFLEQAESEDLKKFNKLLKACAIALKDQKKTCQQNKK